MIEKKGPDVTLPDSSQINATQKGKLPLPSSLSKEASSAVLLLSLKISSPISLGQLCNDDCKVILDKKKLYAEKDDKSVLEGHRNLTDELWDIPIPYYDVYKKTVQTNTHIQPPTHMEMYMVKEQPSTSKPLQKKRKKSTQQIFYNAFQYLEDLIEVNECNYEVDQKLKIDRC